MRGPGRPGPPEERGEADVPGDEYARAYAEGYGEGLREALRELLQHVSRGHTAQELRILVESRLARVREDMELKRRSLLHPPARTAWSAVLRPPAGPAAPPAANPTVVVVAPGESCLFREVAPQRALASASASSDRFARVVAVSLRPPDLRLPPGRELQFLEVRLSNDPATSTGPTRLSGSLRGAIEDDRGALVYLDAFESLATEAGFEPMLKFITWLVQLAAAHRSAVIVSVDPATLDPRSMSLLQRAFPRVE